MTFLFTNETFLYQILMTRSFVQNIYHSLVRQEGGSPKLEATKGFIGWIHIACASQRQTQNGQSVQLSVFRKFGILVNYWQHHSTPQPLTRPCWSAAGQWTVPMTLMICGWGKMTTITILCNSRDYVWCNMWWLLTRYQAWAADNSQGNVSHTQWLSQMLVARPAGVHFSGFYCFILSLVLLKVDKEFY